MAPGKILIVDDDLSIRNLIGRFLSSQGHTTELAEDGATGLKLFETLEPNLVVLDVNLPDTNGYALCKQMQESTGVMVLMLTSRDDEADKLKGFAQGADDYITKPFILSELGARVAALLKRQRTSTPLRPKQMFRLGELSLNPISREVIFQDQTIALTPLEFDLLHFLLAHPQQVWRRSDLIERVWGEQIQGDLRVVDVHIGQIRKKLEKVDGGSQSSLFIQTVRGVGYKLDPPEPLGVSLEN